jgi:hypothetical protein
LNSKSLPSAITLRKILSKIKCGTLAFDYSATNEFAQRFPERHEVAYSVGDVGRDVRHTFYGVYRILYTIEQDTVVILSVRHAARKPLTIDEVRRLG